MVSNYRPQVCTVHTSEQVEESSTSPTTVKGKDGKTYPRPEPKPEPVEEVEDENDDPQEDMEQQSDRII